MLSIIVSLILLFNSIVINNPQFTPISSGEIISHHYYILSYNEDTEQANWVYYELFPEMLKGNYERLNNFRMDPLILTKSASSNDYTNSGYDRGHLCPAADMAFDSIAMYESFYMSNVSPQLPGFNRGIWKSLEEQVREWTFVKGKIIVVVGPVLNEYNKVIGKSKVMVPKYFFKALYSPDIKQMIAFLMPNRSSTDSLESFVISVDSLEKLTNIDLYSQLPDDVENSLEGKVELANWFVMKSDQNFDNEEVYLSFYIKVFSFIVLLVLLIFVYRIIVKRR